MNEGSIKKEKEEKCERKEGDETEKKRNEEAEYVPAFRSRCRSLAAIRR